MPDARPVAVTWHLAQLDLATLAEAMRADDRSLDDQAEWLDNDRILYSLPDAGPPATIRPDLWMLDLRGGTAAGSGTEVTSPAVIR